MKFKLSDILKSTILLEGRREDAIAKYGEKNSKIVEYLSDNDPSGNNKYLDWMSKMVINNNNPQGDVVRIVRGFHENLSSIEKKDINQYKTFGDLNSVVSNAILRREEKMSEKEADKIFENDEVIIYSPLTVRASCKYGAGSKWCIAGRSGELPNVTYNTQFDSYTKNAVFYFFLRKNVTKDMDNRGYKWALQYSHSGEKTWWDAEDTSHSRTPGFVTTEMMSAVDAYNGSAVKNKLQREIKSFITQPNVNNYNKYSSHLTSEQKTSVINRIISQGDLSNNTFKVLVKDLTIDQKNLFIDKYIIGKVSPSDFKEMEQYLDKSQKIKLIKNNSLILNNYDVLNKLDKDFSVEEKSDISKSINTKQITNTDSKVILKKWSMSDEELSKHGETSFYVFLSNENSFISEMSRVDPLNPYSYRAINMMKLNIGLTPNTTMHGIKTKTGLLDPYVGKNINEIPQDVIDMVRSQSRRIEAN